MEPETIGQYEIIEELGKGGMGTVYKSRDPDTDEFVALKVLPAQLAREPHFVMRFKREIATLKELKHPNIAGILDTGEGGGLQYYVMEYVDGMTLEEILEERGRLPVDESIAIVRQVAQALDLAHSKGIIHRDIKPANIMIELSGHVKLTDFGVAKMLDATRMTGTGGIVGTAEFMSPEQAEGRSIDARTDIYSLGIVFYRMLTGRLPFTGVSAVEIMKKHRFDQPEPPKNLNVDIPANLAAAVERMLAKAPTDRFESAQELIRILDRLEEQKKRAAGAEPVRPRPAAAAGRDVKGIVVWIIVLIALMGGLVLLLRGRGNVSPADRLAEAEQLVRTNRDREAGDILRELLRDGDVPAEIVAAARGQLGIIERKQLSREMARMGEATASARRKMLSGAADIVAGQCYYRGLAYLHEGDVDAARKILEAVRLLFAETPWGARAAARLEAVELGVQWTEPRTAAPTPESSSEPPATGQD